MPYFVLESQFRLIQIVPIQYQRGYEMQHQM